ncbi:hypothetical protein FB451DRAFT_1214407, partial [Mycena latifolia]
TCTTFRDPALDLLWSNQDTLLHFLDTFPHDLIEKVRNEIHLLRPVCPSDWEPLSLSCPGGYMFPNLQALRLTHYPAESASSINFLISPQLQAIRLDFGTEFRLLCQIVPTLSVKCPSLTCVDIAVDDRYDAATLQVVSDFVLRSSCIEVLTVPNLDLNAFKHLGGLTSLRILKLEDPKHMFSSLTELHFGRTTVDRITTFISIISNSPLKELEADSLDDAATSDAIGRLYSALAAHCSHDSLQRISESASPDQYRIHRAILRTLFCFGNMVSIGLYQCSGFDLDDADIFDMASAWPRLEFLSLTGAADRELKEPRVTVQGFHAFAHHCPNLKYLGMTERDCSTRTARREFIAGKPPNARSFLLPYQDAESRSCIPRQYLPGGGCRFLL